MDSSKTGSITTQEPKNDLDSLFSELLHPDKKEKPAHTEDNSGALLSQFLDHEIGDADAADLSPDLDLKLAEALKEVGLQREKPIPPRQTTKTVVPAVPKVEDLQSLVPLPAVTDPPPAVKPKEEVATPPPAVSAPLSPKPPAQPASRPARAASGPLSITASVPVKPAGSNLKLIVGGLVALAAVAVGAYFYLSGSGTPSPQPVPPAAVQPSSPALPPDTSQAAMNSLSSPQSTVNPAVPENQVRSGEKASNPPSQEPKTMAPPPSNAAEGPVAPVVSTWSPAESVGSAQNLPLPSQAAVRGSDLPMPGVPLPPPPPAASPAPATPAKPAAPISSRLVPAEPISKVMPVIPEIARKMKVTGVVKITAKINEQGKVTQTTATEGPTVLRASAEGAVRQWKFKPAQLNGVNVASEATFSIEYR